MKVVASDLGRYEQESWVENVVIAPAERFVVDVRFEQAGEVSLVNRVRAIDHILARFFEETQTLGSIRVATDRATPDHAAAFARLRRNADVVEGHRPLSRAVQPRSGPRAGDHAGDGRPAVSAASR